VVTALGCPEDDGPLYYDRLDGEWLIWYEVAHRFKRKVPTQDIREQHPETYVLVLTTYDSDEWVFDAIRAGASGYLLKDGDGIIAAIEGTIEGKTHIDTAITDKLLSLARQQVKPDMSIFPDLTARELIVLKYMARGMTNREIAKRIHLAEGTVRSSESTILLKIAVEDIDHSKTKARSPQTNGICERFHKTIQDEFYAVAFRKKIYHSLGEIQEDVDKWIEEYNMERTYPGKYCFGKTPWQTFPDSKRLADNKMPDRLQPTENAVREVSTVR